jgi:hypothetical protein
VNKKAQLNSRPARGKLSSDIWAKAAVVMLLVCVAGLSTLAKNGQYFSKSSPAQQVSISTKMDVGHAPVVFHAELLQSTTLVIPPQPPIANGRVCDLLIVPIRQIGITVSMQHRAPPSPLS